LVFQFAQEGFFTLLRTVAMRTADDGNVVAMAVDRDMVVGGLVKNLLDRNTVVKVETAH
jgi:hypothetical protein